LKPKQKKYIAYCEDIDYYAEDGCRLMFDTIASHLQTGHLLMAWVELRMLE